MQGSAMARAEVWFSLLQTDPTFSAGWAEIGILETLKHSGHGCAAQWAQCGTCGEGSSCSKASQPVLLHCCLQQNPEPCALC